MSQFSGCTSQTNSNYLDTTNLYLSSLTKEVKDNEIFENVSAFGEVENVQTDNEHSFAIVKFTRAESAAKALDDEYQIISDHRVSIGIDDTIGKPLESGFASLKNLLDLNDDCFYELLSLKSLSIMDLCSIARTSSRLRDIANTIFTKKFKKINLKSSVNTIQEARRLIATFGSLRSEIWLSSHLGPERRTGIFDLLTKCCSNSLRTLYLYNYDVPECVTVKSKRIFSNLQKLDIDDCTIKGASKDLFGDCESLVELVVGGHDEDMKFIFDNTFPQLTTFRLKRRVDSSLGNFISRHKNLKYLNIWSFDDCSFLFPIIADNCKQLEELRVGSQSGESVRFEQTMSSILTLKHITKLQIECYGPNVTRFTQELSALKSLKDLKLSWVHGDPGLLPALSQLKQLQILRFDSILNEHTQELNLLCELEELRELSIRVSGFINVVLDVNLDIVCLVKHLTKLITLELFVETFELDKKKYLQILKILRQRVIIPQQTFEIKCFVDKNITDDLQHDNRSIIKVNNLREPISAL